MVLALTKAARFEFFGSASVLTSLHDAGKPPKDPAHTWVQMVPASTKIEGEYLLQRYFPPAADVRGLKLLHVFQQIMTIIFSSFIFRTEIHRSSYICSHLRDPLPSPLLSSSRQNWQKAAQEPVWKKLWEGAKSRLNPEKPRLPGRAESCKYLGLIPDFLYFINPNKAPRSIFVPFQHLRTTRRNGLKIHLSLFHLAVFNSALCCDIHDGNRCPWMSRAAAPGAQPPPAPGAAAEAGMGKRRSWG